MSPFSASRPPSSLSATSAVAGTGLAGGASTSPRGATPLNVPSDPAAAGPGGPLGDLDPSVAGDGIKLALLAKSKAIEDQVRGQN